MVTRREWYGRVNAAWPATIPPLTLPEAARAARRLLRFSGICPKTWLPKVRETSGNRRTWIDSEGLVVNTNNGWRSFVHRLSHWIHWHKNRHTLAPHDREHAKLELRLVKQVVRRGWIDGRLRDRPRLAAAVSPFDERERRIELRRRQVKRLETKVKSLTTRLRNARRSLQALERFAGKAQPAAQSGAS